MHVIISPAKKQDFTQPMPTSSSEVLFGVQANTLVSHLKQLSPKKLSSLMKISQGLAELNHARFQNYHCDIRKAKETQAAVYAYVGDTYKGLNVSSFTVDDLQYAQQHVSILSGLYGALRPLDLIQPYRLEMGTKRFMDQDLYQVWSEVLTEYFNQLPENMIINLASQEYSSVLNRSKLLTPVIDVMFYQERENKLSNIGILAKKARGQMASFIVKNQIKSAHELIQFSEGGYVFQPDQSSAYSLVFIQ